MELRISRRDPVQSLERARLDCKGWLPHERLHDLFFKGEPNPSLLDTKLLISGWQSSGIRTGKRIIGEISYAA